jgi:hemolysin III
MANRTQTLEEEKINALTHGIGILFALVAMPFLLQKTLILGNFWKNIAITAFGLGMLAVYCSSTLYHAVQEQTLKAKLQICDHVSIFFLIGGSYAPFVQHYTDSATATVFLSAQWVAIALGAIFKLFFTGKYDKASVIIYLFLGWSAVFLIKPFSQNMPLPVFYWILAGGLSYTIGVIFYRWEKQKYAHAIWHLFVLGGTVTHFVAAWKMLN